MAKVLERTTSIASSIEEPASVLEPTYSIAAEVSPQKVAYLSDPDFLIRQYFLDASLDRRVKLRKVIADQAKSFYSILQILKFSRQGNIQDAYDAGVDALAEFSTLEFHYQSYHYLEAISHQLKDNEDFWEILTKGVSCAYKVAAEERFELVCKISRVSQRRLVKTAVIDALVTIADDLTNVEPLKDFLIRYTSEEESDVYVRDYAHEALDDLE
jgi:hypothetical protein